MIGTVVAPPKAVTITIGPGNTIWDPKPGKIRPSGHATFVIENNDTMAHTVSLPLDEFVPGGANPKGPKNPMDPNNTTSTTVEAGDIGVISLKVKDGPYFEVAKDPTYKYTVHSDGAVLDPEIEINN
jgi:hypothetical protein